MVLVSLAVGGVLVSQLQTRTGAAQAVAPVPEQGEAQELLQPEETMPPETNPEPMEEVRQVLDQADRDRLTGFLEEQTGQWSVWLKDLETGATFTYNEEYPYYPASLLKAPYVYWLCLRADSGEIDLDGTWLTNEWKGELAGTPWEEYDQAEKVPALCAVYLAVARSDNTATDRLNRVWPTQNQAFQRFLSQMGFAYPDTCVILEGIQGIMTARDGGAIMETLWYYFRSNAPHAAVLKEIFLAAEHEILYIPQEVEAAKKYGSWEYAYHDMAIVYGEHPYILCVMSDQGKELVDDPPQALAAMESLGQMVWEMLE